MSLLERERQRSREKSVTAAPVPPQRTAEVPPLPRAQIPPQSEARSSTQKIPSVTARSVKKRERTEAQLAVRRERNKRKSERKRARKEAAALSEAKEIPRLPLQDVSRFGTAANKAPLPFNRLEMPRPRSESTFKTLQEVPQNYLPQPETSSFSFNAGQTSLAESKTQLRIAPAEVTQHNRLVYPVGNAFGSPFQPSGYGPQQNIFFSSAITNLRFPNPNPQNVSFSGPRIEKVEDSESEEGEIR